MLAGPVTTVQLQVSTQTVNIRVGPDHEVRTTGLARSGWSSLKVKVGEPTRPGGPIVEIIGSMSAMSGLTTAPDGQLIRGDRGHHREAQCHGAR